MTVDAPARTADRGATRRGEIEGLRVVAALLVAVYHVWFAKVSGGVDVFFVVTGFLITTTLLGHVRTQGRIAPLHYLGRIARRVWPMAAVVLVACVAATIVLVPAALRPRGFQEILASATYWENWYLASRAIDYLDAEDPPTLVQHFWAMSIQGQFYVAWMVLAMAALWLGRRSGVSVARSLFVAIGVVVVVSFSWSIIATQQAQNEAYFSSLTRLWEFGLGGLVAIVGHRALVGGLPAAVFSWIGLVGLVACGLVLPVQSTFPGWVALWPVTCAMLLLTATRRDERAWSATRLLAWQPLVRLGGVAFGIYLWHWPILVLHQVRWGDGGTPGLVAGVVIIASSVLLALLSHRVVEQPVASAWNGGRRARVVGGLVGLWLVVLIATLAGSHLAEVAASDATEAGRATERTLDDCFGASVLGQARECAPLLERATVIPDRARLLEDTAGAYACYTSRSAESITTCRHGPDDGLRVVLVGTSHAAMFWPELKERAEDLRWRVDTLTGNGCTWGDNRPGDPDVSGECRQKVAEAERMMMSGEAYDLAIFAGGGGRGRESLASLRETFQELEAAGTQVVAIEDNPRIGEAGRGCVLAASDEELRGGACSYPEGTVLAEPDIFATAAEQSNASVVRTRDLYCLEGRCDAVIGNVVVYRDSHHLTATYIRSAMTEILARVDANLED